MYRIVKIISLCCFVLVFSVSNSPGAWFERSDHLVTINGVSFQPDDFKHWWDNWRERGTQFPADPKEFIDWKLLVLEAQSMELDQEPSFKQKLVVFYKARTRVLLKYDTVDSKIQISDKDIEARFQSDYSPIWRLTILYFNSRDAVNKAYEEVKSNTSSFDALKKRLASDGGPVQKQESKFRPINFKKNKEELEVIRNLSVGEVTAPQVSGNYFVLIRLEGRSLAGAEELQSKEKQIRRKLNKEKQAEYTSQLVKELKEKFAVQIDEDLLVRAHPDMAGDILAKPIVQTNRGDLPLGMLVKDLRKEFNLRKKKTSWTNEEIEKLARGLLNGMTVEYLLTWEAEDRRYDEKPPFKWTYEFYTENRLIKELEQRLIAPRITVSDAEITQYYEENIEEFTPPDMLSLILVKGEEEVIKQLWVEVNHGQDIIKTA